MSTEKILKEIKSSMEKAVEFTLKEFTTLHIGKASTGMVDMLTADVYGSPMKIKDIATILTPDHKTVQIQPWDKESVKAIEKAILTANIGLTPRVDGMIIRCSVPEMSRESRQKAAKVANTMAEEGRVRIRGIRRDGIEVLKKLQKDGIISEDDLKRLEKDIQKLTDTHVAEVDSHLEKKTSDLMKV